MNKENNIDVDDSCYKKILDEISQECVVFSKYREMVYYRDLYIYNGHCIHLDTIYSSAELTLESFYYCCCNARFADASMLLRKYSDDLFFSIFVHCIAIDISVEEMDKMDEPDEFINGWLENCMKNLQRKKMYKSIIDFDSDIKEMCKRYAFDQKSKYINEKLNDFVHGNGFVYYNKEKNKCTPKYISENLENLMISIRTINIIFFLLVGLVSPTTLMKAGIEFELSENFSENFKTPIGKTMEPFIEEYIKNNSALIGDDCFDFFKSKYALGFNEDITNGN